MPYGESMQGPDSIRLSSPLQAYIDWELTVPDDIDNNAPNGETNRLSELQKWAAALQFWTCRGTQFPCLAGSFCRLSRHQASFTPRTRLSVRI